MKNTEIVLAEVKDTVDLDENGSFDALILGTDDVVPVTYVSPYSSGGNGGAFIAIPEIDSKVLICKLSTPDESGNMRWYYLGSVFDRPMPFSQGSPGPSPIEALGAYEARGIPTRYSFTTPEGAGIEVREDSNKKFKDKKTILTSSDGGSKKIRIDDKEDAIVLESGNNSSIRVNRLGNIPAGVEIDSQGAQRYSCRESSVSILVGEGGDDITIRNKANGAKDTEMYSETQPYSPQGNINLQSDNRDINIITKGKQTTETNNGGGRVYIVSMNEDAESPIVQIETRGVGGGVVIKTTGQIHLSSTGSMNVTTGGNISMKAGGSFNVQANGINMNSSSEVNIDGQSVNLAPPGGVDPDEPSNVPGDKNQFTKNGVPNF